MGQRRLPCRGPAADPINMGPPSPPLRAHPDRGSNLLGQLIRPLYFTVRRLVVQGNVISATIDETFINGVTFKQATMTIEQWFRLDPATNRVVYCDQEVGWLGTKDLWTFLQGTRGHPQLPNPFCRGSLRACLGNKGGACVWLASTAPYSIERPCISRPGSCPLLLECRPLPAFPCALGSAPFWQHPPVTQQRTATHDPLGDDTKAACRAPPQAIVCNQCAPAGKGGEGGAGGGGQSSSHRLDTTLPAVVVPHTLLPHCGVQLPSRQPTLRKAC